MGLLDKICLIIGPILILVGGFMMRYADKKKIKTDPLYGLYKFAANLTNDVPMDKIILHEKKFFPFNKKMNILLIIGIVLLIIGTGMTVYVAL